MNDADDALARKIYDERLSPHPVQTFRDKARAEDVPDARDPALVPELHRGHRDAARGATAGTRASRRASACTGSSRCRAATRRCSPTRGSPPRRSRRQDVTDPTARGRDRPRSTAVTRAVILSAVRTPVGRYGGGLAGVRPDDLAAIVIAEAVARAGVPAGRDRGRLARLREPGRRGQPQRRALRRAARGPARVGGRRHRQPPLRLRPLGDRRGLPRRDRRATATSSSRAASSR